MKLTIIANLTMFFIIMPLFASAATSGEQIFNSKCAVCHSTSNSGANIPILFGQEPAYIKASLVKFRDDSRHDNILGVMNGIAKSLSDEEIYALSTYVAGRDLCEVVQNIDPEKEGFMDKFKAGAALTESINCMHCHATFHHMAPRLFGQKKDYITASLTTFKSGERIDHMMNRFAEKLSPEDIENLGTYLNGMLLMRSCEQ